MGSLYGFKMILFCLDIFMVTNVLFDKQTELPETYLQYNVSYPNSNVCGQEKLSVSISQVYLIQIFFGGLM